MAQLNNTTIDDTGFIRLPNGTTGQRPTGSPGQMRYNSTTGKVEFYNGTASEWVGTPESGVIATGGRIHDAEVNGTLYRVHVFNTIGSETFTVQKPGDVEYLIVAGGGGGGDTAGGGGGAGGLLTGITTVSPQSYTIIVGDGGVGSDSYSGGTSGQGGFQGNNSSAFGLTAVGGGGGGSYRGGFEGNRSGGSGGGVRGTTETVGGAGTDGQGNDGGDDPLALANGSACSGGGGAGEQGHEPVSGIGGDGGTGILSSIGGISTYYAGGGGGSGGYGVNDNSGNGGFGGGGHGGGTSRFSDNQFIDNGGSSTGGGGGGNGYNGNTSPAVQGGGNGGSGIVIIRYPLRQENPVSAYPRVVSDNLIFELDFGKPSAYLGLGNTVTDSRVGITGTISGAAYLRSPASHRAALQLDNGGASYISIPKGVLDGLTSWTIDFWLERTITNTIDSFLTCGSGNNFLWFFNNSAGQVEFQNTGVTTVNYSVTNGVPFNFTATGSGGTIRVYKNGVEVGTMSNTTTISVGSTIGIILGQEMDAQTGGFDSNQSWKGKYYSAKFYDRVLTATEVENNYEASRWRFGI